MCKILYRLQYQTLDENKRKFPSNLKYDGKIISAMSPKFSWDIQYMSPCMEWDATRPAGVGSVIKLAIWMQNCMVSHCGPHQHLRSCSLLGMMVLYSVAIKHKDRIPWDVSLHYWLSERYMCRLGNFIAQMMTHAKIWRFIRCYLNTLMCEQNGWHFADVFRCIFLR